MAPTTTTKIKNGIEYTVYVYEFKCRCCHNPYEFLSLFGTLEDDGKDKCEDCKAKAGAEHMRIWNTGICG